MHREMPVLETSWKSAGGHFCSDLCLMILLDHKLPGILCLPHAPCVMDMVQRAASQAAALWSCRAEELGCGHAAVPISMAAAHAVSVQC